MNVMTMNERARKRWALWVGAVSTVAVAGVGTAIGSSSPRSSTPPSAQYMALPTLSAGALPATFEALRAPAAAVTSLPDAVRSQMSGGDAVERYGVDVASVRVVGPADHRFYVVSGTRGLCLLTQDGAGACSGDLAALKRNGFSFSMVPAPRQKASAGMDTTGPGTVVTYGLAPDGVSSVEGLSADGHDVAARIALGAYVVRSHGRVVRLVLHGANATWSTLPGGVDG